MELFKRAERVHLKAKGKIEVRPKLRVRNASDLSDVYGLGVATVCKEISKVRKKVFDYTLKQNTVCVVGDGSSIFGLGNVGAYAAIPFLEGKCMLFKELADVNAFPISVDAQDDAYIIQTIMSISPAFGAVCIEGVETPKCFFIERALSGLGIPVVNGKSTGTAIVVLAALINSAESIGKKIDDMRIVVNGGGSAGLGIAYLLANYQKLGKGFKPIKEVLVLDKNGLLFEGRSEMDEFKAEIAKITNHNRLMGNVAAAMIGADAFVSVSSGNIISPIMIKSMSDKPIIFTLSVPELAIDPEAAKNAGASVIATSSADFPNQISDVLAFPGLFKGALEAGATTINVEMKLAAAKALADYIKKPTRNRVIPTVLDKLATLKIAAAVKKAAVDTKVVRK